MKIVFNNVGQGDSIILESEKNRKIVLIDCHRHNGGNPSLDYIIDNEIEEIELLILSHPHYDHYSGLLELLEYCESKEIKINYFGFTFYQSLQYLKWASLDDEHSKLLQQILKKINSLREVDKIGEIYFLTSGWGEDIDEDLRIDCLSPSDKEHKSFTSTIDYNKDLDELQCSKAANYISTLFLVKYGEQSIVLSSDVEKMTFERLFEKRRINKNKTIGLCQIPHHGANVNHYLPFWRTITTVENCPAVISAGENKKYNHPHLEVIEDFAREGYVVKCTNNINGMKAYNENVEHLSLVYDSVSIEIEQKIGYTENLTYLYLNNKFQYIPSNAANV